MAWLKRNLGLVIVGVVFVAILTVAVIFLLSKKAAADTSSSKLDERTEQLKTLGGRNPGLSPENITAAKDDQKKLDEFLKELKHLFVVPSYPTQLTSREFGVLLDTTVNGIRRSAQRSGVQVEKDYKFSFDVPSKSVKTPQNAYESLAIQLVEVESICNALLQAKVNAIKRVRRAAVTSEESAGTDDFVDTKASTNEWTIVSPYEVTFTGFSGDAGNVLEGLIKSKNCITVKNIVVERGDAASSDSTTPGAETPAMNPYSRYGMRGGMSPSLASRYGLGRRPAPAEATPTPQAAPTTGPRVLQDEKLLKVTLTLETVRLNPTGKAAKPAAVVPDPAAAAAVPAPVAGADEKTE
ncbi:MAG: hypothetical protein EXS30_06420 [Pedosphaera sp.]|nr:hypothetical protein [Pedosphaera sp.]